MKKNILLSNSRGSMAEWYTVKESVGILCHSKNISISESDIYRHALYGNLNLSLYFQSSVILREIQFHNNKVRLSFIRESLLKRLCFLETKKFLQGKNITLKTDGEYFQPNTMILDTNLSGYEYIYIQKLLSNSLGIPRPSQEDADQNFGITVNLSNKLYMLFEKTTWFERMQKQADKLAFKKAEEIKENLITRIESIAKKEEYFPLYDLPIDACFVIKKKSLIN